jgi:hypothetical protein
MNKNILYVLSVVIIISAGAFYFLNKNSADTVSTVLDKTKVENSSLEGMDHSKMNMSGGVVSGVGMVEIENQNSLQVGKTSFKFKVNDDNKELTPSDLKVSHEKIMHFLVIKDDISVFEHLHPEYIDGKWQVDAANLESGKYNIYVDILSQSGVASTYVLPVKIGVGVSAANFPKISADSISKNGDYTAEILEKTIESGSEHSITFKLSKNGSGLGNIMPYLGAYGHTVIIDHSDPMNFVHSHPLTESKPANSQVAFEATFKKEGVYTVFGQFNIGGTVTTFPVTIKIEKAGTVPHDDSKSVVDESKPHGH